MNTIATLLSEAFAPENHFLERISYAATTILVIVAALGLKQVRAAVKQARCALEQNQITIEQLKVAVAQLEVSRADIAVRSKREAIGEALGQCKHFAESIVPHVNAVNIEMAAKNYPLPKKLDANFPMIDPSQDILGIQIWQNEPALRMKIVQALNELESFAMYFATDLADESVAFTPTALTFCQTCEYYQFFIGAYRQADKIKLYQNLVKLYGMWKPRLELTALEEQSQAIEVKKKMLPAGKKGTPIGT